ncbi:hypothetical protein LCGC14_2487610 [marine sediment metagenome]|uniref:SprT-like domain-containing protein n=1 Tax=marine sediment metagenome TaxID=412755 RepID=A0A0F9DHP0_9ZZZZ
MNRAANTRDLEVFKREFTKYQELFGLTGITVHFKFESVDGAYACLNLKYRDMVAEVILNSDPVNWSTRRGGIRGAARHEAIHLLLMRLEGEAMYRHATENSIYEAVEETVHRLENVIP